MLSDFDPNQIQDEGARQAIVELMNLVEDLKQENATLREEVQRLRDENRRLKGEQGQPQIKPGKKKPSNHSSESERRQAKGWGKGSKNDRITIDREERLAVEGTSLPADAEFKGYEEVVVQDLSIKTDNIRFLKEKFYSAKERMSYTASLPAGYQGQFGPGIRALVLVQYYSCGMSEPKIQEFLENFGVRISAGQISNQLIKNQAAWQREKEAIYQAGLSSSSWQHIDETGTRVDGVNHYCHIICNPLYTAYFTRPHKDRLTVISLLQNRPDLQFLLNRQTLSRLAGFALPQWVQRAVSHWPQDLVLSQAEMEDLVQRELNRLNAQQQARLYEAAALSAYYQQPLVPVVPVLVSDEARQYEAVTPEQALCWVHEGRHYKKLSPYLAYHQQQRAEFLTQFWKFYHHLQRYRADPTPDQAHRLRADFDTLFSTVTGYQALDNLIAKTKTKKEKLLKVLDYPEIPLHNNPAELGARQRVRKREVSFGPRTDDGLAAWDTFMTLAATAQKLGVSFFAYVYDRVTEHNTLPSLAALIQQRSPVSHPITLG
jgi:regulator of replication initiation timing